MNTSRGPRSGLDSAGSKVDDARIPSGAVKVVGRCDDVLERRERRHASSPADVTALKVPFGVQGEPTPGGNRIQGILIGVSEGLSAQEVEAAVCNALAAPAVERDQ